MNWNCFLVPKLVGIRVVGSNPIKGSPCSLYKKLYLHCLVLVGSRNHFERDFRIDSNKLRALCQIRPRDKHQTPKYYYSCVHNNLTG